MDTQSFITTLEKLLAEDDLISVGRDAQDLKESFMTLFSNKKEKNKSKN